MSKLYPCDVRIIKRSTYRDKVKPIIECVKGNRGRSLLSNINNKWGTELLDWR